MKGMIVARVGAAVMAPVAAGAAAIVTLGYLLSRPRRVVIGDPPDELPVERVEIPGENDTTVRGWLVRGTGRGVVLLLHGYRGNRLTMLGRAKLLRRYGFSSLLIDCQAHGETPGTHITFGWRESRDAASALTFLRARFPGELVGVIGTSQGAAATLVGPQPLAADAIVLESVYPTIRDAIAGRLRLRFRTVGLFLAPLLMCQIKPRLGIPAEQLRPIDRIREVTCPVLVAAGTKDGYAPVGETEQLFERAPVEPKDLWLVAGAGHDDLLDFSPAEYERRIVGFLARTLRPNEPAPVFATAAEAPAPAAGPVRTAHI